MASGDTLVPITMKQNSPPAANFATPDKRNQHDVLDFDAATPESAVFKCLMPRNYAGGGVTVYIHYAMTSAEADTVDWDAAFERIGDQQQDIDSDGFAAVQSVDNTTVPGTTGLVVGGGEYVVVLGVAVGVVVLHTSPQNPLPSSRASL